MTNRGRRPRCLATPLESTVSHTPPLLPPICIGRSQLERSASQRERHCCPTSRVPAKSQGMSQSRAPPRPPPPHPGRRRRRGNAPPCHQHGACGGGGHPRRRSARRPRGGRSCKDGSPAECSSAPYPGSNINSSLESFALRPEPMLGRGAGSAEPPEQPH